MLLVGSWALLTVFGTAEVCRGGACRLTNGLPVLVRVIEGRAAVFASTNAVREAVAWMPSGTDLTVRGELQDEAVWVCVEPPERVSVWIYRELVRDGEVVADKSRLRSGAGLNFRTIGSLNKGERVDVRGKYGDWLRIRPPAELDFWVLRDQVEPLATMPPGGIVMDEDLPAEGERAGLSTNRTAEVPVIAETNLTVVLPQPLPPRPLPPELAGAVLADAPNQGEPVLLAGVLDFGAVGGFEAPFCLVEGQASGDTVPVCHLLVPVSLANPHVGTRVALGGTRWHVKGVALPVLVVHSLRALE